MKASEHREVEILGRLQAALELLSSSDQPANTEIREHIVDARIALRAAVSKQWEVTTSFVESDDT